MYVWSLLGWNWHAYYEGNCNFVNATLLNQLNNRYISFIFLIAILSSTTQTAENGLLGRF